MKDQTTKQQDTRGVDRGPRSQAHADQTAQAGGSGRLIPMRNPYTLERRHVPQVEVTDLKAEGWEILSPDEGEPTPGG